MRIPIISLSVGGTTFRYVEAPEDRVLGGETYAARRFVPRVSRVVSGGQTASIQIVNSDAPTVEGGLVAAVNASNGLRGATLTLAEVSDADAIEASRMFAVRGVIARPEVIEIRVGYPWHPSTPAVAERFDRATAPGVWP